ncbi:MAG: PBP1A family penicillin-binding protein [Thermodesulforhabdaceae bacterium]
MSSFKLFKPKRSRFFYVLIGWTLSVLVIVAGVFFYFAWQVEKRFSGQKWSIPSYVFSDTVILFPGQPLSLETFSRMLTRRFYRKSLAQPSRPGEYWIDASRGECIAWFRSFNFPGKNIQERRLIFKIKNNILTEISSNEEKLPYWELEPVELARLFGRDKEQRILVNIRSVSPFLKDAVVAIEDKRFYDHPGIDFIGIARALWTDLRAKKIVQGGSTITQQLVKNYFLEPERTLKRKILEAIISIVIELRYSKDEILEMYLNEVYMGQRGSVEIRGIGEAARVYFGRNVEDLSLTEAATLAGMIKAPNFYNPTLHPDRAKTRRDIVLEAMAEQGKIDQETLKIAKSQPLETFKGFNIPLKQAPYFVDLVFEQLKQLYDPKSLESDGLAIYTSLIPEIEEEAEQALRAELQKLETSLSALKESDAENILQGVIIAVQPKTGMVRALVGGRDYSTSMFNRATKAMRQVGSAIKPFIYLEAIQKGWTPASWLDDEPLTIPIAGTPWTPENYYRRFRGRVTLREALEQSLNVPTVRLAMDVGLEDIISFLKKINIFDQMEPYPSIALGALETTPLQLASAYTALANDGDKPFLITVKEVYDAQGVLQEQHHMGWIQIASPAETFLVTSMLEGVVQRGTARSLASMGINFPCAGKTGTTSDYRDSWFVGYTTDMVSLAWVGFDDNRSTGLSGATGALRVWARFMKNISYFLNPQPFQPPSGIVTRSVCSLSGALAIDQCPSVYTEYFIEGREPTELCPIHGQTMRPVEENAEHLNNQQKGENNPQP